MKSTKLKYFNIRWITTRNTGTDRNGFISVKHTEGENSDYKTGWWIQTQVNETDRTVNRGWQQYGYIENTDNQ
jgi:hypothetical protein